MRSDSTYSRMDDEHNETSANTHFFRAKGLLTLGVVSFAIGTFTLFHEHTHNRRIGIYWLSDAALVAGMVLAGFAANQFKKGITALKSQVAPVKLHDFVSSMNDDEAEIAKPCCQLASRVPATGAGLTALIGTVLSAYAVIRENFRLHTGQDHDVSAFTEEMLVGGLVFVAAAAVLSFIAARQKTFEIQHPGYNKPDDEFTSSRQSCTDRWLYDPTTITKPGCCPV